MDKNNSGADSLFFALMLPLLLYIVYLIREFQVNSFNLTRDHAFGTNGLKTAPKGRSEGVITREIK